MGTSRGGTRRVRPGGETPHGASAYEDTQHPQGLGQERSTSGEGLVVSWSLRFAGRLALDSGGRKLKSEVGVRNCHSYFSPGKLFEIKFFLEIR